MKKRNDHLINSPTFRPAWWLRNPHLQTLWPTCFRRALPMPITRRERFELSDGDFVDLDWVGTGSGPIIILLHGLEGSIRSPYAKGMLNAIQQLGWRSVFMHFRCCSGEPNRLPRSYHSGDTGDLAALVQMLQQREPNTPLAAIGFSLGGNILLKWLGETGKQNPLKAAVAISVPFELAKVAGRIQQGFSRVYQWHFLSSLRKKMHHKFARQPAPISFPPLSQLKTIHEFDDKVTAPLHGFASADEYYDKSSSRQFLKAIEISTLLIQAKDDPFMTPDALPHPGDLSSFVQLELTEKGGHVGFITGIVPWRPHYWLEKRVPDFLIQHLE